MPESRPHLSDDVVDFSTGHIDFAALESFRFAEGGGYPPSYRDFIRRYGWARTFGLWLIYPPVFPGYADGRGRAEVLNERFRDRYRDGRAEEFKWMIKPNGDWARVEALHVFGWSENGDALLWDTSARRADGEFPVWESRGLDSLHLLGPTLSDALSAIRDTRSGSESRADIEPLPPVRL